MTDFDASNGNRALLPAEEPTSAHLSKPLPLDFMFSGEPAPGYVTDFGSSLRSSRVKGTPREYRSLGRIESQRHSNTGQLPIEANLVPRMILITPDAQHIVVDWGRSVDYRDSAGGLLAATQKTPGALLYVANQRPYSMANLLDWGGKPVPQARSASSLNPGTSWLSSVRIDQTRRFLFAQAEPEPESPTNLAIQGISETFTGPNQEARSIEYYWGQPCFMFANGIDWPRFSSAIDADFWAAVVQRNGTLHVLSSAVNATGTGPSVYHRSVIPCHISDVSIIPPGIAVVEEVAPEPARFHVELVAQDAPATTVRYLTPHGRELWKVTVPFGLGQPPIDCGNGRICLAGFGLARVHEGRIEWSSKSPPLPPQSTWPTTSTGFFPPPPVRATAFQDGTLAVAERDSLRIVAPDGGIKQDFKVGAGELITTPPAIAPDGKVWVATQHALYCLE